MAQQPKANSNVLVLAICYVGFVSLGLPDTLIGVAWPSIRESFHLRQSQVSWIFTGAGCSYFLSSFFAGRLLTRMGIGTLLAASSALVAASGFDYSFASVWLLFAIGSLLHGLGSGAIDAGLNHYVASRFSARHMNWLHACYSLGAMLGPVIMTAAITRGDSWRLGYLIVAVTLLTLSVLFLATRSRWTAQTSIASSATTGNVEHPKTTAAQTLRTPIVWLQIMVFFVYTGLEVSLGQWSFTVLTESRHISQSTAGFWVSIYWASILAGRIGFGFIVDRIEIDTLVRLSTLAALAGTILFAWNPFPTAAPLALAISGLGLAVIFPCLMTRTPQRIGPEAAAHAIGFQVGAAMLGAAAVPSFNGLIAQRAGLHVIGLSLAITAAALLALHEVLLIRSSRHGVAPPAPHRNAVT